ncbi:Chromosome partitioning ATPase [Pseudomonas syringae pv. actinidiae]|uniref:Chromosome partitioning ATPase n=1 Tax=Pseudomonas syringae pv. actinidiae TaxID=103796 RepID=A0AAN4TQG8_PSESF|nr:Chromosome partitioning ATPase [Pseudomonas syringae pv. actinidiae]
MLRQTVPTLPLLQAKHHPSPPLIRQTPRIRMPAHMVLVTSPPVMKTTGTALDNSARTFCNSIRKSFRKRRVLVSSTLLSAVTLNSGSM